MKEISLWNTDAILNHISYALSSLYHCFFLHLTQQPDTTLSLTFKTASLKRSWLLENGMRVS